MESETKVTETHIEINAPWGKYEIEHKDHAGFIKQALDQLLFFKNDGRVASAHLLLDINGYEIILNSDSPNLNSRIFLDAKSDARDNGTPFKNNMGVITFLKKREMWK